MQFHNPALLSKAIGITLGLAVAETAIAGKGVSMARIDPAHYPDHFAFDAHARQLQMQEMDRLCVAALQWTRTHSRDATRRIRRALAKHTPHAGAPLPH